MSALLVVGCWSWYGLRVIRAISKKVMHMAYSKKPRGYSVYSRLLSGTLGKYFESGTSGGSVLRVHNMCRG